MRISGRTRKTPGTRRPGTRCRSRSASCLSPFAGEDVCGDGWAVRLSADHVILMVVDGLGHGILAAEAAREADAGWPRLLGTPGPISSRTFIRRLKKLAAPRSALTKSILQKRLLSFAGVGNIRASIVCPGSSRSMASHNGTLGQQMEECRNSPAPWNPSNILVMHSDGLTTRWDLERYPGIWNRHPSLIAAVLHRDFCRGRDDVTVLVAKAVRLDLDVMTVNLFTLEIRFENDVVVARQKARRVSLGLEIRSPGSDSLRHRRFRNRTQHIPVRRGGQRRIQYQR